jgi:rhodanese-related sulfurtransferase
MMLIQAGMDGSKLYNLDGGIMAWHAALPEEIVR